MQNSEYRLPVGHSSANSCPMPRVSVVIPCYNTGKYLRQALDSVLAQTYPDWEVILVNDGSTDNSAQIAMEAQEQFGSRLKYIYQSNRGLSATRNIAFANASGEFISFLDADDIYTPDRLQRGVEVLDADPSAGLVHSKVDRIDEDGNFLEHPPAPHRRYLSGRIARHIFTRKAHVLCPSIMFRKQCMVLAGASDENLNVNADRDICFRIALHYPVIHIDEILAHYRIQPMSMSKNHDNMMAGAVQFVDKYRKSGICGVLWVNEALGNLYREWGDECFNVGKLKPALVWYFKSILKYPFSLRNLYMLFRALGEPLLAKLRPKAALNPND